MLYLFPRVFLHFCSDQGLITARRSLAVTPVIITYVPCRSTYLNSIIKTKNCKINLNKFETVHMFQNIFYIFSTFQCSHIFKSRYCETQTQLSAPGRLITYPHIRTYPWHHHTVFIIPFKARSEMETISLHFLILNLFRGYHQVFQ